MRIEHWKLEEDLILEAGGHLTTPTVAYSTYGTLNESGDNVIWVCHALTANSRVDDWWNGLYGENNVFDPSKYFIVCANNLGSPYGTVSPKSENPDNGLRYGLDFPLYTLKDTAILHLKLAEQLGIKSIRLLIGGSCGGNISQEMAILNTIPIQQMVIMCCSAKETPWVISIHESQRIALNGDSNFQENSDDAGKEGLRGARAFALPFYRSHPSFGIRQSEETNDKLEDFKAASYVRYQGDKFVNRYDAHCYYKQLNALDTHNVGRGFESIEKALSSIEIETLVIGFSSDLLIPVAEQQYLAEHIPNAKYHEVETSFGHDAFLIEVQQLQESILDFIYNS